MNTSTHSGSGLKATGSGSNPADASNPSEVIRLLGSGYDTINVNENSIHSQGGNVMQLSHDGRGGDGWHSRASTINTNRPVAGVLTRMGSWVELGVSLLAPFVFGSLIWYVGFRTIDDCPLNPLIPVWLIVDGAAIVLTALLNMCNKLLFTCTKFMKVYKGRHECLLTPNDTFLGKWVGWFEFCVVVPFLVVWTIFGGVWVFGGCQSECKDCDGKPCTTNTCGDGFGCNKIAYYTVMWLVIGASALIAVAWACGAIIIAGSIIKEQTMDKQDNVVEDNET